MYLSDLTESDLSNAKLKGTNFKKSTIKFTNLSNTILSKFFFDDKNPFWRKASLLGSKYDGKKNGFFFLLKKNIKENHEHFCRVNTAYPRMQRFHKALNYNNFRRAQIGTSVAAIYTGIGFFLSMF